MLSHSHSLEDETEFLRMCQDSPHVIRSFGVKIADFGLSLTLEQSWTQKQGMRGTKRYMAPESLLKQEYGPEVDIWALGCTVYELITGTPLWESSNADPKFENDKLSTEAKDFLRYCLIKNPKSRWSAGLLLNHSFLKSADSVLPPKKRKRQHGYMSSLQRPHQKRAFRTQPHIRHLVIEH
ncbi:hypothetical protein MTR67_028134 [Solanum verrucosum]|uniref:Protein kinase domain-containing protein n=1 Tax=Solanum verrucosum TaxID=315347 RepID=A0AAF0TWD2_SOLVR|nr:hypothetical protein MTR67_028134 [Solanum verrucosum]